MGTLKNNIYRRVSLTPCFSWVLREGAANFNRFNGFPRFLGLGVAGVRKICLIHTCEFNRVTTWECKEHRRVT